MTVIIPYTNDYQNGEELRFAIRSMEKYFTSMTALIVVGHRPKWYKGEHYFTWDIIGRKEYSMYMKVMMVAVEPFLYTTDDHFALRPFDDSLPNYYYGTCKDAALNNASGRYKMQYKNCPDGWLNYDIHTPIVMKPFDWPSSAKETDTPIKSTYANIVGVQGTELIDCKFKNPHTYDEIKRIIADRPFFSTSPFCMNRDMLRVLNELYPDKSSVE